MYISVKQLFDILLSLVFLLLLSPFMIPIVIALRLTGEGDIFYRPFRIWTLTFMLKSNRAFGMRNLSCGQTKPDSFAGFSGSARTLILYGCLGFNE